MTHLDRTLKEIEERLANATPGPWRTGQLESYNGATGEPEAFVYRLDRQDKRETAHNRICVRGHEKAMDCDADAELIASAPTDLAQLLAVVKVLRETLVAIREQAGNGFLVHDLVSDGLKKADALCAERTTK